MTSNKYPIKNLDEVKEFDNNWVGKQGIVQDGKDLLIKINYPTLPAYLKADI